MMKKRCLCIFLALTLLLCPARAAAPQSGPCSSGLTWQLDTAGTLTISGSGDMDDYAPAASGGSTAPWGGSAASIRAIVIEPGITGVGAFAFYGCSALSGSLTLPDGVLRIGESAFRDCGSLTEIVFPASLVQIGSAAFSACSSLKQARFLGDAPELGDGVFLWHPAVFCIYYPGNASGWSTPLWNGYPAKPLSCSHSHTELRGHQEPDCLQPGRTGRIVCLDCGAALSEDGELPALGHDYQDAVLPPTCTESGVITHTCSRCGDSAQLPGSAPLGHTMGGWTSTRVPTCDVSGIQARTCGRCGLEEIRMIPALGHAFEDGFCLRCGAADPNLQPVWFSDVPPGAWYEDAVFFAVQHGLFAGVEPGRFGPEEPMTRAMLVTVLWRYAGRPEAGPAPFRDVRTGSYYSQAVAWAAGLGIVAGVGGGRFDPSGRITREQLAAILCRYARQCGLDCSARGDLSPYEDRRSVSSWAEEDVRWAVAQGILSGSLERQRLYLWPRGNATRAQVASMLMRAANSGALPALP